MELSWRGAAWRSVVILVGYSLTVYTPVAGYPRGKARQGQARPPGQCRANNWVVSYDVVYTDTL